MLSSISIQHYSDPPRIRKLDLEVKKGEMVLVLGDSGSGKSRLVRRIAGIEQCRKGCIEVAGGNPGTPAVLYSCSFLFQSDNFDRNREVVQQLVRRLCLRGYRKRKALELVLGWCKEMKLDDLLHRKPLDLNLDQVQRLSLAQVLLWTPVVAVLDEPLCNLNPASQAQAAHWISGLREHAAVLVTASAPTLLSSTADRTVEISVGDCE
jgi:ABC-type sugar transport system ATPase subunit